MSDDPSRFGDDEPTPTAATTGAPAPIADWQVDLLRRALDARGLESMGDRQRSIEAAAGRTVPSLRGLTAEEANRILSKLADIAPAPKARPVGSRWDERDEATWIDRL